MTPINRGSFWLADRYNENDCCYRTITESVCGTFFVTACVSKLGEMNAYSDRYIAEQRVDGNCIWFSRHRTESAAFKEVMKRTRTYKRLKASRKRITRTDLTIKRKKI